jgi:hypothetical protein
MKHILLIAAFVSLLLSPTAALGQTPPPTTYDPYDLSNFTRPVPRCAWWEYWCSESAYRNPNLSPVTKRKLYEHDPNVCHCDECRRARLAAGIEYMGYKPYRVPTPGLIPPVYTPTPVVPRTKTPAVPPLQPWRSQMLIYCRSTNSVITRAECPDKR